MRGGPSEPDRTKGHLEPPDETSRGRYAPTNSPPVASGASRSNVADRVGRRLAERVGRIGHRGRESRPAGIVHAVRGGELQAGPVGVGQTRPRPSRRQGLVGGGKDSLERGVEVVGAGDRSDGRG